jgi:hypothetical protein
MPKFRSAKVGLKTLRTKIWCKKSYNSVGFCSKGQIIFATQRCHIPMKIKSFLARPFANYVHKQIRKGILTAVEDQKKIFRDLIKSAKDTDFGREHHFHDMQSYDDFKKAVPIRDYEQFRKYIDLIKEGRHNVLWKGQPIYFAKTSGTTSGVKYIPISRDSISNHINSARNALLCYIAETGNHLFTNGKMIFLSGSPELGKSWWDSYRETQWYCQPPHSQLPENQSVAFL